MRISLACLLLSATLLHAADEPKPHERIAEIEKAAKDVLAFANGIKPADFQGIPTRETFPFQFKIDERIALGGRCVVWLIDGDKEMIVEGARFVRFYLKGLPTKGLADGSVLPITGKYFKISGTKNRAGSTFFVLEPDAEMEAKEAKLLGTIKTWEEKTGNLKQLSNDLNDAMKRDLDGCPKIAAAKAKGEHPIPPGASIQEAAKIRSKQAEFEKKALTEEQAKVRKKWQLPQVVTDALQFKPVGANKK